MSISFSQIPGNWKQPLFWAEVDPSMAGVYIQQLPAMLVGQMFQTSFSTTVSGVTYTSPAGTAAPNVPVAIGSPAMANALFGTGFVLAQQFAAFFNVNAAQEVWGLPLADPTGAYASGTITVTGPATQAGTINLYIAGQQVVNSTGQFGVGVSAGDSATTIASNIAAAINFTFSLPVTASPSGGVVTLTAKHKGLLGNDITLMDSYYGSLGGEAIPAGVTLAYSGSTMAGGTGTPSMTTAISNIQSYHYEYVGMPYTDSTSILAWDTEYGFTNVGRWGFLRAQYGVIFSAFRGSYSSILTQWGYGEPTATNSAVTSILGIEALAPTPVYEVTGAYVGVASLALTADPARPLQSLELTGCKVAQQQYRFHVAERNAIAFNGIATEAASPNGWMMIMRETLNYQVNNYGQSDSAYELVTTLTTLATLLRNMKSAITSKYPRCKLADDDTNFGPGQAIVTPKIIKAEIVAQYSIDEYNGLVENSAAFKNNLIVERDTNDPNRVNVLYPPDLINQLRVFATLAQFRLQFNPTNGGAPITNSASLAA